MALATRLPLAAWLPGGRRKHISERHSVSLPSPSVSTVFPVVPVTWGKQLPVSDTLPLCCTLFVGGKIDGGVRLNGIVNVRMV